MMGEWNLPTQAHLARLTDFNVDTVLVEYNGPQIVTATGPHGRYLGVAADEDKDAVRWTYAPITHTELRALAAGATATRDVFYKSPIYVIDIDHSNNPIRVWECDIDHIGDENLPDPGTLLPKATRDALMAILHQPDGPELAFERLGSATQSVPFRALSEVLNAFQRLWNALAQSVSTGGPKDRGRWSAALSERAALSLASATQGSLILRVEPSDTSVFEHASASFEELVRVGDDPQALAQIIARLGDRVRARYEELLTDIEKHDLQMFAQRRLGAAFLSPGTASRVRVALPQSTYEEPKTRPAVGYFVAFDTAGATFEFVDETAEAVYKGQVHPDVIAEISAVAVGPGATHAVFIEVTTRLSASNAVSETYVLRAIAPPLHTQASRVASEATLGAHLRTSDG
jgi:hypothetical protein